ncbi:hypothetical protein MMC17_006078 [Xylographa soralifera]|nr:hypothetical protein [Xylographa soralifera]
MSVTHPFPQHETTQTQETFRHDIEAALKAYLPSGQKRYQRVTVLLTSWNNAPANEEEIDALEKVFRNIYNFETENYRIPVTPLAPRELYFKVSDTLRSIDGKNDLFIFYYGGHATHEYDKQRAHTPERSCVIRSNPFPGRPFVDTASGSTPLKTAHINLTGIMTTVVEQVHPSNVLYILDCCYASSLPIRGTKELIAACAINRTTPGAGHPGIFTRVLAETLANANGRQFTIAQLHGAMTRAFFENKLTTPPVHVELSAEMVTHGSIVIAPLKNGSTATAPHQQMSRPFSALRSNPKALVSVHLSDVKTPPYAQQWTQWLSSHIPSGVEEIQIDLVGFYQTSSSILLVTMPVEVWTVLRGDPAYVFISIVTSGNMMPGSTGFFGGVGGLAIRTTRRENILPGGMPSSEDVGGLP